MGGFDEVVNKYSLDGVNLFVSLSAGFDVIVYRDFGNACRSVTPSKRTGHILYPKH